MKKIQWLICASLVVFNFGCGAYGQTTSELKGVFKSENGEALILNDDQFYLVAPKGSGHLAEPCCDTLALGDWTLDNKGFLVFNSPHWLSKYFVEINVKEKASYDKDSIYFELSSPIETGYRKYNDKGNPLSYSIRMDVSAGTKTIYIDTNRVAFQNKNRARIEKFSLFIEFNLRLLYLKNLETLSLSAWDYKVKNPEANVFEIDIPRLELSYLTLKRLKDDYVKVVSQDTLRWNGTDYIKK